MCTVRQMVRADLDKVLSWRNHIYVRRHMLTQHKISISEHQKWFETNSKEPYKRMLIVEEEGLEIGYVNLNGVAPNASADWGFYLTPYAPKGSGKKFSFDVLNFAFCELNLQKICGQVLSYNKASIRFHRNIGFHQEKVLCRKYQIKGVFYDLICFGLHRNELFKKNINYPNNK